VPLNVSTISAKTQPEDLLDRIKFFIRERSSEWVVKQNGDIQRRYPEDDVDDDHCFHPTVASGRLVFTFKHEGVYDPKDYADYYSEFIRILIREFGNDFLMIRIQLDEVDVSRSNLRDARQDTLQTLKDILTDNKKNENERIKQAIEIINQIS